MSWNSNKLLKLMMNKFLTLFT